MLATWVIKVVRAFSLGHSRALLLFFQLDDTGSTATMIHRRTRAKNMQFVDRLSCTRRANSFLQIVFSPLLSACESLILIVVDR